ncbi:EndoU domain-containing protein [Candidatus Babeliales bacterium]|nr:EndoU domain-containing protein [Candidatus Babeliales bacterium]MBP9843872.1 EndoU domain-containing protein [Candidatus Babeliales bacterium]
MTLQKSMLVKKIFDLALRFLFLFLILWNVNLHAQRYNLAEFAEDTLFTPEEIDINTYDGQSYRLRNEAGDTFDVPVFYDEDGGVYTNQFTWNDDKGDHQGYVYMHPERGVSIVEIHPQSNKYAHGHQELMVHHPTNSNPTQNITSSQSACNQVQNIYGTSNQAVSNTSQGKQSNSGMSRGERNFLKNNLEQVTAQREREHQHSLELYRQASIILDLLGLQAELQELVKNTCEIKYHGKKMLVNQDDLDLFEAIYYQNQQINKDRLFGMLADDPRFNSIAHFYASNRMIEASSCLGNNIKINFDQLWFIKNIASRKAIFDFYTQKWEKEKQEQEKLRKIALEKQAAARQIALEKIAYNELKSQQKIDSGNVTKQHTQEKLELDRKYNKEKNQTKNKSKLVTINNEYKKEKNELAIKQAHEQTLLDAQQHEQRPTLFSWAAKRVAEIQYQIFPTDKNKTAEVLRAEAQQAAAIQNKIQQNNSEQKALPIKEPAIHKISVQELEQSLHDFVTQNLNSEQKDSIPTSVAPPTKTLESKLEQSEEKLIEEKRPLITSQEIQTLQQQNHDLADFHSQAQEHSPFQKVMENRSNAFEESLKNQTPTTKKYSLNPDTAGFLQAQGIDTSQFQQLDGLDIQHLLTKELLDVLDSVVNLSLYKNLEIYQQNLAQYCATLASLSQQCNQAGLLPETIQGTNCCHGITHYLDGSLTGALEQFQTGMQYFNAVLDYGQAIAYGLATGAIDAMPVALAMTAAAAVLSPVVVGLATQAAFVTTAVYVGYLCQQAWVESEQLQTYFLKENWDKVHEYLDQTYEYVTKLETVENGAHFVGGFAGSYSVSAALQQLRSLQPVIGIVKLATGQISVSAKLVNKQEYTNNLIQARELLEHPDFKNFNMYFKRILGVDIFTIVPNTNSIPNGWSPELVPAIAGIPQGCMNPAEQSLLAQIFLQSESDLVKNGASIVKGCMKKPLTEENFAFLTTEIGQKMLISITQDYENAMLRKTAQDYKQLLNFGAPEELKIQFFKCCEISLVPDDIKQRHLNMHETLKVEFPALTMNIRHIFYPKIKPKFTSDYQNIIEYTLEGFHHDENGALEKAGKLQWQNKKYGKAEYGAEECFMAESYWNNGILCASKTFFPSNWTKEKTAREIVKALKDKLQSFDGKNGTTIHLCRTINNLLIEVTIDSKNVITTGYPSELNF